MVMKQRYDVIVIGSGFGGAVSAARLAQAGLSVAVLERGRRWGKSEFPRTPSQLSRGFWQDREAHGFLEYRAFARMDVIQGVGVGGGSLHYFNVHLRPQAAVFARPRWPALIRRVALDPYYELAEQMLGSERLDTRPERPLPPRTRAFVEAARRAGYAPGLVPIGVYTGPERLHPLGGNPQTACVNCGNCLLGCHVHAKNTLDFTYLGLAERRHGAEVFPSHAVEGIEPQGDGSYRVRFRRLDPERPRSGEPGSVVAQRVVVAAGTLGSNELLLRCRDVDRTLPRLSRALGRGFSGNGDMLFACALATDAEVDPGFGPSITAGFELTRRGHRIMVEDLGFPDPFFWYLEGILPPRHRRLLGLKQLARAYVLSALGLAPRVSRVSNEVDNLIANGRTGHVLPFLGMGDDAGDGVLSLRAGELDLRWSHAASRAMFREMERVMREVSAAAGGRYRRSLLWKWPFRKLLTAHPLGGCAVGDSPGTSVSNHYGQVWNYPGLYVIDGSMVPTALAANPSLTISALAERAAFWILHGREMGAADKDRPNTQ